MGSFSILVSGWVLAIHEAAVVVGFGSILLKTPLKFTHEVGATVSAQAQGPDNPPFWVFKGMSRAYIYV